MSLTDDEAKVKEIETKRRKWKETSSFESIFGSNQISEKPL